MITPAEIAASPGDRLDDLGTKDVVAALADRGVVHFRGFAADGADFARFSDRFSEAFTCDPHKYVAGRWNGAPGTLGRIARKVSRLGAPVRTRFGRGPSGSTARFAPFEGYGLNPHNENSYLPGAFPDVVWFHCTKPAGTGGSTVLVDGRDVLAGVDDKTEGFLRNDAIRYRTTLQRPQWQAAWGLDEPALRKRLDADPSVTYELSDAGVLQVSCDSTQVFPTMFDGADAVRSNLLSLQPFDRVRPDAAERLANGDEISIEILQSLLDAARQRLELDLAAGEIIMIDNSRVMHGRTPFDDPDRRIETRCAWLREPLLESARQ